MCCKSDLFSCGNIQPCNCLISLATDNTAFEKKIKQLFEYYVSSRIIYNICCKNPRNSHAYDVYEVDRLDDNIIDGKKQKKYSNSKIFFTMALVINIFIRTNLVWKCHTVTGALTLTFYFLFFISVLLPFYII